MDINTLINLIIGFGFVFLAVFGLYAVLLLVSWIIAIIRIIVNDEMSNIAKILWIIGIIIFPILPMFYFAFPERNGFLKFCGWFMIICSAAILGGAGYLGYKAGKGELPPAIMEAMKPPAEAPADEVVPPADATAPVNETMPSPDAEVPVLPTPDSPQPEAQLHQDQIVETAETVTTDTQVAPPPPAEEKKKKFKWYLSADEALGLLDGSASLMTLTMESDPAKRTQAYNEGLKSLDKILISNPRNAQALTIRGMLKDTMQKGQGTADLNAAVSLATQAITAYPDMADLYATRARALGALDRNAEARADLDKAIMLDPMNEDYQRSLKVLGISSPQ